ncbi:MAG: 2,5-diamino-6-(ribosylamino)-4(3H)-pyrimidinone 5'-phosphate reductase [Methanospirillum sp.]|nr:2,5-diamino-6-(ribosylamino)-4(3H)-pyrimidinone 5'-phosphate reductase [Methanospirillum sp.]
MRPHVFVNAAISADGKLSTYERRQVKISGPGDFRRVDRLRAGADAVMVGIGTVLADDPSLTVKDPALVAAREAEGRDPHPVRVVVDSRGTLSTGAAVLHRGPGLRVVGVSEAAPAERRRALGEHATVIVAGRERVDLRLLLEGLHDLGVRRLMVEGGGTLIASFLTERLADELMVFVGNMVIGGATAPTLADGPGLSSSGPFVGLDLEKVSPCDEGVLIHWRVKKEG